MAHGQAERLSAQRCWWPLPHVGAPTFPLTNDGGRVGQSRRLRPARQGAPEPGGRGHGASLGERTVQRWLFRRRAGPSPPVPRVARPAQCAARCGGPRPRRRLRPRRAGQAGGEPDKDAAALLRACFAAVGEAERRELAAPPRPGGGLVPRASGIDDPDLAKAVAEREDAIAEHALDLAERAVGRARPGPRPLARRPSARPSPRPGGTALPSSPPIGTAGVLTLRASSARPGISVRSPRPPTAPGRNGRDRKLLAWPEWCRPSPGARRRQRWA